MKLFVGPSSSGKTERLLARAAEIMAMGRGRVLIVSPSATAATGLFDRLKAVSGSTPNVVVNTFPFLYESLLNESGLGLHKVGSLHRLRLLRRVIQELSDEGRLGYFAETAERPGLASSIIDFIGELWRSGTSPSGFSRLVEGRGGKAEEIALVFERYSKALDLLNGVDVEGFALSALRAFEERINDGSLRRKASFTFVAADGFDLYSPVQVRLLALLSRSGVEVIATLTYEEDRSVHSWQEPTRDRFRAAGAEVIRLPGRGRGEIAKAASDLMSEDEQSIGALPAEPNSRGETSTGPTAHIVITSAMDRAQEAREAAREIKRLIIKDGYGLEDIGVVCRSLSLYSHHFERVCKEFSIPVAIECPLALGESPLVLALMRLLSLTSRSLPRRLTLDCFRSPYFDLNRFHLSEASIDSLDRVSIGANVTRGQEQWVEAMERASRAGRSGGGAEADFDRLLAGFLDLLSAITPPRAAGRSDYADYILGVIERLGVERRLESPHAGSRDEKALAAFRELVTALGEEPEFNPERLRPAGPSIMWRQFYSELEQAIVTAPYERPAPYGPALLIQEAHNVQPRRFRALFLPGLIEGEFPLRTSETTPFTRTERVELRQKGVDLTETPSDPGADLFQFHKAMTRASDRLYLSYARTDVAGGELLKSYLIDEVRAVARVKDLRLAQSDSIPTGLDGSGIASLSELALATARAVRGGNPPRKNADALSGERLKRACALLEQRLPEWKAVIRGARIESRRLAGGAFDRYGGVIEDGLLRGEVKKRYGSEHLWSASQLNDYGTCPFRFFAAHALGLNAIMEPVEGFVANRLGTAYHSILESIYTRLRRERVDVTPTSMARAHEIAESEVERELEAMASRGEVRKGRMWEFEKVDVKRRIMKLLSAEAVWNELSEARPVAFEMSFGRNDQSPLVLEAEGGEIKICGVVDRIDRREEGYVVVDYKTGRTPISHREAIEGRNLQLPIYMLAAARVILRGAPVAAGYYLHINSRKKGSEFPHRENEQLSVESVMAHAEERVRRYVGLARAGNFSVQPNGDRCPAQCRFQVMCRIQSTGPQREGAS